MFAALKGLSPGVLGGLVGVKSDVKYDLPEEVVAYRMEEAARKFEYAEFALEGARENLMGVLDGQIKDAEMGLDETALARLKAAKQNLATARGPGLAAAIAAAQSATSQAVLDNVAQETPEKKAERLLGEAVAKDQKAQDELHATMLKAHDNGDIKNEAEYNRYLQLREEEEAYKKAHPDWWKNPEQLKHVMALEKGATQAAENSSDAPEVKEAVKTAKEGTSEVEKAAEKNQKSHDRVEQADNDLQQSHSRRGRFAVVQAEEAGPAPTYNIAAAKSAKGPNLG